MKIQVLLFSLFVGCSSTKTAPPTESENDAKAKTEPTVESEPATEVREIKTEVLAETKPEHLSLREQSIRAAKMIEDPFLDEYAPKEKATGAIVEKGKTTIEGISDAPVHRIIRRHGSTVKECYEAELNTNASAKGSVTLEFGVNGQGKTENIKVVSTDIPNATFTDCVATKIPKWRFIEPHAGSAKITYELLLSFVK